jgi:hypothetical protein
MFQKIKPNDFAMGKSDLALIHQIHIIGEYKEPVTPLVSFVLLAGILRHRKRVAMASNSKRTRV